jgi:triacylglycerol lipase
MILLIILLLLVVVIGITVYFLYREGRALDYTISNPLYCGKKICDRVIDNNINFDLSKLDNIKVYNKDLALFLCDLINRISDKKDTDKLEKVKELYVKENFDVFGVLWKDKDNNLYIIFRGTHDLSEWIKDFHISQNIFSKTMKNVSYQVGLYNIDNSPKVHLGFLDIYNEIKEDINKVILSMKPKKIVIGGHSLGAGISVLCGVDLSQLNVVVYNFGCPRVGDNNFVEFVKNQNLVIYRHVNSSDSVTTVPAAVSPNYSEYDKPYFYSHCGIIKSFDSNWESLSNNHSINCYIDGIKNNLIS